MNLSLNTLLLCRTALSPINGNASRSEIEAVLDARDELDAAIAEAQKATPEDNRFAQPEAEPSP